MVETEGKDGWDLMVESFDPEGRVALEEACQLFKKNQHTTRSCAGPEDVISAFQQRHIFVFPAGAKAQTGGCCLGILGVIFVAFAIGGGVIGFRTGHYTYLINPIDAVILGIIGFITGPFGLWMFATGAGLVAVGPQGLLQKDKYLPWGLVQRMGVRTWQNRGSINYAVEIEGRGQKIRLPPDDIKMLGFPEGDKLTKLNHLRLLLTVYSDLATKGRFF